MLRDLAGFRAQTLKLREVLCDLAEGTIEHRHVVLQTETQVEQFVRLVARDVDVSGLERDGLVAVGAR
ncbi:MAG: hypothetical protein U1E87_01605 [Alphaproteobacteria bacterium]